MQTDPAELNTKGALQQFCEGRFPRPQYVTVDERGPEHAREFSVEVRIDGEAMGRGNGHTKQQAEKEAAREALHATARPGAAAGRTRARGTGGLAPMYLRRVEAYGFKAFADRQVFEFGPGLTAVVGPNGSGKSNVSDAIRWALGEQSARSIRARKTGDVIFSGSDGRREMGVAEVTLYLDNSEQWMPIDFDEVSVSRRAYRSGESEYRINGQKVRLLDVQDLFRRAQVGQNSYAMMSQGLVDEMLGLRPLERRNLIEEAAEVHGHRIELTRADRRLTQTRDNLGHVRVLIRELAPRLRQLERQSKRASRFRELDAQLGAAPRSLVRDRTAAGQRGAGRRAVAPRPEFRGVRLGAPAGRGLRSGHRRGRTRRRGRALGAGRRTAARARAGGTLAGARPAARPRRAAPRTAARAPR